MGVTAAVVGAVATLATAGAQIYAGAQKQDAYEREAEYLKEEAEREAGLHKDRTRRLIASQRAKYGASGVRVDEGSPLAVIQETQREADEELEAILKGYGRRRESLQESGEAAFGTGLAAGAGTLLSGAGQFAERAEKYRLFK